MRIAAGSDEDLRVAADTDERLRRGDLRVACCGAATEVARVAAAACGDSPGVSADPAEADNPTEVDDAALVGGRHRA